MAAVVSHVAEEGIKKLLGMQVAHSYVQPMLTAILVLPLCRIAFAASITTQYWAKMAWIAVPAAPLMWD